MKSSCQISVDFREPDDFRRAIRALGKTHGFKYEVVNLDLGDMKSENVIIEHKGVTDLVQSILDDRLRSQCERMANEGKVGWVVINGSLAEAEKKYGRRLRSESVVGALVSMSVRYGTNIFWGLSAEDAAYFAWKVCEKVEEGKLGQPRRAYKIKPKEVIPPKVALVKKTFEIPTDAAEELIKRFGSLQKITQATEQELLRAKGIGETRAKRIYLLSR